MSTVCWRSQHLSSLGCWGGGGNAYLPIEHLVAYDETGGGADGLCEEVGGRGGGHFGEMARELVEAWEHAGRRKRGVWRGVEWSGDGGSGESATDVVLANNFTPNSYSRVSTPQN